MMKDYIYTTVAGEINKNIFDENLLRTSFKALSYSKKKVCFQKLSFMLKEW